MTKLEKLKAELAAARNEAVAAVEAELDAVAARGILIGLLVGLLVLLMLLMLR